MGTKASKRNRLLNAVMVTAIIAILFAGIMVVGSLKGWFDRDSGEIQITQSNGTVENVSVLIQNKVGSANIERKGISYFLENGTTLRNGDVIETLNGSSVDILVGKNRISLDENSRIIVNSPDGTLSFSLTNGGIFADISEPFSLRLMDTDVSVENGVISTNVPYGSAVISVFAGNASVGTQDVMAGKTVDILSDGLHTSSLSIQSLNSFDLKKISLLVEAKPLCFDKSDIDKLNQNREEAKKIAANVRQLEDKNEQAIEQQRQENMQSQTDSGNSSNNVNPSEIENNENLANDVNPSDIENNEKPANDVNPSDIENSEKSENVGESDTGNEDVTPEDDAPKCTIEIRCDTILNNMGDLTEGKNKYVPSDGTILATSILEFEEGETVFDVLKRACSLAEIQIEYSWTPMYNSYYIEGINNLYEFDCGNESGWMYKVNGWFPNYGCSAYSLKDGDVIVWCFTCQGLGADVGCEWME